MFDYFNFWSLDFGFLTLKFFIKETWICILAMVV